MEEINTKLVYISVPYRLYREMQKYGIMGNDLSPWFVGEMMGKVEEKKEELQNGN